jgi:hypothetical protein
MSLRVAGVVVVSLFAVGCSHKAKDAEQAAAAKAAESQLIDERSRVVAVALIDRATADAEKKRVLDRRRRDLARQDERKSVVDHPGLSLAFSELQFADEGKRRLTSLSATNTSKFAISKIRGTVDYHGGEHFHGDNGDIMARVPIELSGAIAPGGSLTFDERQHTLTGASIQLPDSPSRATFTVTSAIVAPLDLEEPPPSTDADAGSASPSAP